MELAFADVKFTVCEIYAVAAAASTLELTLCVRQKDWRYRVSGWSVYILAMPPQPPPDAYDRSDYPQPGDWLCALSRRYSHDESHAEHYARYDSLVSNSTLESRL